ncbi:hypothetical protein ACVWYQ_005085 [Bradyrhizobium sp. USDA 3397]
MTRNCPTYVNAQCFGNIDADSLSLDHLKDQVLSALELAKDEADAKRIYEEWRRSTIQNSGFSSHPKTFGANERVGRVRYRPRFVLQLVDRLQASVGSGIDVSEVEDLASWMLNEPSKWKTRRQNFFLILFLQINPLKLKADGIFGYGGTSHFPTPPNVCHGGLDFST